MSIIVEKARRVEVSRSLRILHVSDIHCATDNLTKVLLNEEYDFAIASGDFECLDTAEALANASSDVYAVTGNLDNPAIYRKLNNMGVLIDGRVTIHDDIYVAGIGGVDFKGSFVKLKKELEDLEAGIVILVTHHPPKDILDEPRPGLHIGLKEVTDIVERLKPRLHLFGHVHEMPGYKSIGATTYVNAGPLLSSCYAIINISTGGVTVKMKQLK